MKIQRIETFTQSPNLSIVRVCSDSGAEGWGQVSTFNADISAAVLHRQLAPFALGMDALDLDALADGILEETYKFPGSYVCRALTGLDTALWDLHGKLQGKSVCELLGGVPGPFPVYGSSMRRDITPEDEGERLLRLRDQYGYNAFKIRVGRKTGHDRDQWPGRTEALIPSVRQALGDDVTLLADGNSCYSPTRAIEVGQLLQDHAFGHFEEPCPYWELGWTAQVATALEIPIAGGEQDYDLQQWKRIFALECVDIAQPDICYIGGLTRALRVARMAEEAGLPCVPHSANHSMVTLFTLHMMGAIANAGPHVEFSVESQRWVEDLFSPRMEVKDGAVAIPDGPGWGVEINPEWLSNATHQISEL